ncbi:dual specificity protein phosphatase family protein [Thiothrix sp.]|uniref:protein-tyrosine phosphatase family protein n=1 Tax=Thiothrix sp. TaxID=1032 RepID=UPI002611E70D|nr:dual specificity protein phosphatase family protein [Thiothrix sp.]
MKPLIFEVSPVGAGTLCIMPKPDGNYLPEAVAFFQQLGINRVVCLLEDSEMQQFGLEQEDELCQAAALDFTHFPIADSQNPTDEPAFRQLVAELHTELLAGANITIHCRAGIGRTGVLAGCILKRDGYDMETAIQMVSDARGFPIPETQEQYDFIADFVENCQNES